MQQRHIINMHHKLSCKECACMCGSLRTTTNDLGVRSIQHQLAAWFCSIIILHQHSAYRAQDAKPLWCSINAPHLISLSSCGVQRLVYVRHILLSAMFASYAHLGDASSGMLLLCACRYVLEVQQFHLHSERRH